MFSVSSTDPKIQSMKKNASILSIVAICTVSVIQAQEIKPLEPYYLSSNGKIEQFEKASAKMETKAIGMGYGGANTYLTIFKNPNSSVRFKNNEIPKFFIKLPSNAVSESINIVKADKVKGKTYRRFVQQGFASGGAKDMSKYHISLPLIKTANDGYEISVPQNLEPGEYSFLISASTTYDPFANPLEKKIYCFAIE